MSSSILENTYSSFIHNSSKLETEQESINEKVENLLLVYLCNRIYSLSVNMNEWLILLHTIWTNL